MEGGIHRKAQRQRERIQPESTRKYRQNKRLIGTVSSSGGGDGGGSFLIPVTVQRKLVCLFSMLLVT